MEPPTGRRKPKNEHQLDERSARVYVVTLRAEWQQRELNHSFTEECCVLFNAEVILARFPHLVEVVAALACMTAP